MKWSFQPHVIDIILMHGAPSLSTMHISLRAYRGVVLVEFHSNIDHLVMQIFVIQIIFYLEEFGIIGTWGGPP